MNLLKPVWGIQLALSNGMDGTRKVSLEMDGSREETMHWDAQTSTGKLELMGRNE